MSIQDLGDSLLSNVRDRKDAQYEQQKKDQKDAQRTADRKARQQKLIGYGLKTLIDVGNSVVSSKTQDFLTTEQQLAKTSKIKSADQFSQDYARVDGEIKAFSGTAEDYFAVKAAPKVQAIINTQYATGYNEAEKAAATAALSMNYGASLYEAHEAQRANYDKLVSGDIDFSAYKKELVALQPKTMMQALKTKAAGLFSRGENTGVQSARMMGMLDTVDSLLDDDGDGKITAQEQESAFYNIYRNSKNNSLTALNITQTLQDQGIEISRATPKLGAPQTIYIQNDFGESVQTSVQEQTVNGVSMGWVDVATGKQITSASPQAVWQKAASVKPEQVQAIQTRVNLLIDDDVDSKEGFQSRIKSIVGDAKGPALKEKTQAAAKAVFVPVFLTSKKLMADYGVGSEAAMQIATHMHSLNYQWIKSNDGFMEEGETDLSTSVMPDEVWNSQLALAAIHDIETSKKWAGRVQLEDTDSTLGLRSRIFATSTEGADKLSVPQINSLWGDVEDGGSGGFLGQARFKGSALYRDLQQQGRKTQAETKRIVETPQPLEEEKSVSSIKVPYSEAEMDAVFKRKYNTNQKNKKLALNMSLERKQKLFENLNGSVVADQIRGREQTEQQIRKFGSAVAGAWTKGVERQQAILDLDEDDKLMYSTLKDRDSQNAFLVNVYGETYNGR